MRRAAGFLLARLRLVLAASLAAALVKLAAGGSVDPDPDTPAGGARAVLAHCRLDC